LAFLKSPKPIRLLPVAHDPLPRRRSRVIPFRPRVNWNAFNFLDPASFLKGDPAGNRGNNAAEKTGRLGGTVELVHALHESGHVKNQSLVRRARTLVSGME
jgi:hypothetical protein